MKTQTANQNLHTNFVSSVQITFCSRPSSNPKILFLTTSRESGALGIGRKEDPGGSTFHRGRGSRVTGVWRHRFHRPITVVGPRSVSPMWRSGRDWTPPFPLSVCSRITVLPVPKLSRSSSGLPRGSRSPTSHFPSHLNSCCLVHPWSYTTSPVTHLPNCYGSSSLPNCGVSYGRV